VPYTNAQLRASLPVLHDRFHYGLDLLEAEIITAKTVLRRDLEALQQQRRVREQEEKRKEKKKKKENENEKNEGEKKNGNEKINNHEVVLIEDDTPPATENEVVLIEDDTPPTMIGTSVSGTSVSGTSVSGDGEGEGGDAFGNFLNNAAAATSGVQDDFQAEYEDLFGPD
jgi:hypothetical protein